MTATPVKILLVEDNLADAVLLEEMLLGAGGSDFKLIRADRMAAAVDQLSRGGFDAILLDLTLPDSHGLVTLECVQNEARAIPTIILTGVEDEELAISAIRHGAQDYLVKGTVDGRGVAKAIRYAIDRQKAEEALRLSEAAYMAAKASVDTVNAMEEGVALIDMDGNIRSVNPALTRLTGYAKEELEGSNLADQLPRLVVPYYLPLIQSTLRAAISGTIPELKEISLLSRTQMTVPVIAGMTFIKNSFDQPVTIVFTVQDMTEYKKAERLNQIVTTLLALFARKSTRKEYLDAVARVVQQWSGCRCIGIRIMNEKGEVPYESYVGFSDEFVQSESALMIGRDQCACTRIIAGHPDVQDLQCLTAEGSFWCGDTFKLMENLKESKKGLFRGVCVKNGFASLSIIPVRYHNEVVGAIHFADERAGAFSDEVIAFAESSLSPLIGEAIHRFGVEQSLRRVSVYNRSLIEAGPDPMVAIDEQGRIMDVNKATENLTGFSRVELIGTDFSDYFTEPELARSGYRQVFQDGVVRDYALDMRHRHGRITPVLYNASLYRDEAGRVAGAVATARDISERKKAQQALELYQAELRSLSSMLTLAEERTRRQLAISLHDTVGQTLALLKLKLGALGALVAEDECKKALAEIRAMFDEAVMQIRTLSFELSPPILYELGLDAAIEWLGEDFAKRHGLKVTFNGDARESAIAESVSVLFFQSARELLTNTTKHAAATEVRISLKADNGRVYMKVVDNGRGMSEDEPGRAVNGKQSLGLFSIRERMKHIGGTFEIQSRIGRGTTAILTAPVQERAATVAGASA